MEMDNTHNTSARNQQQPPPAQPVHEAPLPSSSGSSPAPSRGAQPPAVGGPQSSSPVHHPHQPQHHPQQQPPSRQSGRGGPPPGGRSADRPSPMGDERRPLKRDLRRDEEYQAIGHDYPRVVVDDDDDEEYGRARRNKEAASALHLIIFWLARLILAPVCSVLIILVGLAQWYEYISLDHLQISNYVVASYLIFFGLLFIMCELTDWGLRTYFGLLFAYTGRGLAYIFCGSLSFGMANERYWPLGLAVGFTLLGVGVVLIFVGWAFPDLPPLRPWCHSTVTHLGVDEKEERRFRRDY